MPDQRTQQPVLERVLENTPDEAFYDGDATFTLERRLSREPDWVWRMLTTAAGAARWSPCVPTSDLTGTGPAEFQEEPGAELVDGTVTRFDPPHALAHAWGRERLEWALSPADGYTDLNLTMTCSSEDMLLACAAGWHICLATLEAMADGEETARVVGPASFAYGWEGLRGSYAQRFDLPEPAPLD
ncbi:SRPBCC domain-containing protein [Falsarthrobacter nasiphocae]|uniref:Uncharacterized protein YndB with AHSA1/START domain n=1 Tax=Falsarthrobacter nasiphocae TaxID=189863 RepID=A0AAE4C5V2_9MICC|nr:SRPBCC domain-containing protein [Falsarthrobacter nasiphocae]MDR6891878.1 uncharacterized protein YndB with AHSA1/START domain [Falsarthrobacter nasiphocae]